MIIEEYIKSENSVACDFWDCIAGLSEICFILHYALNGHFMHYLLSEHGTDAFHRHQDHVVSYYMCL